MSQRVFFKEKDSATDISFKFFSKYSELFYSDDERLWTTASPLVKLLQKLQINHVVVSDLGVTRIKWTILSNRSSSPIVLLVD